MSRKKRIAIVSTGGTIEKTYDEMFGVLANRVNVLDILLAGLDLRGIDISRIPLMNKDSSEMTPDDHQLNRANRGHFNANLRRRCGRPWHGHTYDLGRTNARPQSNIDRPNCIYWAQ